MDPLTLRLQNVSVRRGRVSILTGVTTLFQPGVTVLLGPNGVGKTSLLERLIFLLPGDGNIFLGEHEVEREDPTGYYARVGFMPQRWEFARAFTCRESVAYAAWLKGIPSAEAESRAVAALTRVGLAGQLDAKIRTLSGGTRQRVGLAEALAHDPAVLILDEPTVGLDPEQRATFRRLVRALPGENVTLLSTHLIDDVEALANWVVVLAGGRIVFAGTPTQLADLAPLGHDATSALEAGYLSIVDSSRQ